jgi:uncharacterized protein (TIGR03437 family)
MFHCNRTIPQYVFSSMAVERAANYHMIILRRVSLFLLFLCASLAPLSAQRDRIARIDNTRTVVLRGRIHPGASAENDNGPVENSFQIPGVTLLLKPSATQQSDLQQLLKQQQDPSSPSYHKWLTPEQYADRFGVSSSDVAKITDWLKSQGFVVSNTARSRTWITFSGTAEQARTAFHTDIHRYNVNGKIHYANATDPSIPADLADVVAGFRGLNDFHLKPRLKRADPNDTQARGVHHIAPDDLAIIYDIAPLYQAGVDGTGQQIMIVGQSGVRTRDIQTFRSTFNLSPPNLQQVLVPNRPDPGIVPGDADEAALDIEWSGAVARNATIVFVYSDDVWQSAMYAVDQNLAPVLSMSYGSCEASDLTDLPTFQSIVQQANAQGITWLAAAGDAGAADCEDPSALTAQNGLAVDVPGSIPEVTSMGGTEFSDQSGAYWSATNTANSASALSYIPEQAWNDTALGGGLASTGGGASIIFPQPTWQTGPGVPSDGFRHVPDLSIAASANHDGYFIYSGGSIQYVGGTSAAAPTMAGMVALLNQYLVSTGAQSQSGVGNINPTLYRLAQSNSTAFHDITAGDNIVPCVSGSPNCAGGSLGLSAGPGYDPVTGLGSVDVFNLVHQWSSTPPLNSAVVPSVDQIPVFQQQPDANGNSWSFKITLNEEDGIGTTLTDFTIDGASYASQIPSLFGGAVIPANGSISAQYGFASLAVPKTVMLGFTGIDASGTQWTTQLPVQFNGPENVSVISISNAASGQPVYAPGMMLSINGTQLSTLTQSSGTFPLPPYLAGFEALINGVPAPIFSVSPGQVNVQIPYETRPGQATLVVGTPYQNVTTTFQVSAAAPGIFTLADGTISPSGIGAVGQMVTMLITGEGQVRPSLASGATPSSRTPQSQLPKPQLPVTVTVGSVPANIQVIGIVNGMVGETRIDFTIPNGVPVGVQPVVVTVGSVSSPPANLNVTQ